jgi:DNA invertase Pin-like site-specific DNA recombinase
MIQERVRAGLKQAKAEGKRLGRPPIPTEMEKAIRAALNKPGRTEGVRKIAARFALPTRNISDTLAPPCY